MAATPESIQKLKERGLGIRVERGAGEAAGIGDDAYVAAGAELTDNAWATPTPSSRCGRRRSSRPPS
ncbi:MAG: hypothetical protein IPN17_26740 [Deltaproteobacteria bacterium]|nr:hypothetical protein [Deltaproteobacteria bacterium]